MSDQEFTVEEKVKQKLRCKIRQQQLETLQRLEGKKCELVLHGGFKSRAVYRGCDRDQLYYLLEDFLTPTGEVSWAKVRATDVTSIQFPEEPDTKFPDLEDVLGI